VDISEWLDHGAQNGEQLTRVGVVVHPRPVLVPHGRPVDVLAAERVVVLGERGPEDVEVGARVVGRFA
jgi:hypothetical protein